MERTADPSSTTHNTDRIKQHLPAHELAKVGVALHAGHVQGPGASGGRDRGQEGMGGGGEEGEGQEEGLAHHVESRGARTKTKNALPGVDVEREGRVRASVWQCSRQGLVY